MTWVVVVLFAFLVFTEVRNYLERKSLTDRLMSRNFTEFVTMDVERAKVRHQAPGEPPEYRVEM